MTSRHPVNVLQYRRTLVDTGARRRSLTAEWVLCEETVIDIAHHITVPDGGEVERQPIRVVAIGAGDARHVARARPARHVVLVKAGKAAA